MNEHYTITLSRRTLATLVAVGTLIGIIIFALSMYLSESIAATNAAPLDPNVPRNSEAIARGAGRIREIRSVLRDVFGLGSNMQYLDSAMLISTDGGVTFLKTVSFWSGLGSAGALTSYIGPSVFTDRLQLQSNFANAVGSPQPPPVNTLFADMLPKARLLASATPTTGEYIVLTSYNIALVSEISTGTVLISLTRAMSEDNYYVQVSSLNVGGSPQDNVTTGGFVMASYHLPMSDVNRRRYFLVIIRDSGSVVAKRSFGLTVWGTQ